MSEDLDQPMLCAPGLRIRAFRPDDVDLVIAASVDPAIVAVTTVPPNADREAALAFVARQADRARTGQGWSWAIAAVDDDLALGQIGLWPQTDGSARVGYWVAPAHRGQHVASRALISVTAWAHEQDFDPLDAHIEPDNGASQRSAMAAGYERRGTVERDIAGGRRTLERFVHEVHVP